MSTEQHPTQRRYTAAVVARARVLADAGWSVQRVRRLLAKEFGTSVPSWVTVKEWVDEDYAERKRAACRARQRDYAIRKRGRSPLRAISPELALDRMREMYRRGVSLRAIGQVAEMWWGEELSADQVRSRLGLKAGEVIAARRAA